MKPIVVVQLSDLHIGATWAALDAIARLRASVVAIGHLPEAVDAVVVSGDLADHGEVAEYELIRDELRALKVPVHVIAGNHDRRAALRCCFGLPGDDAAPVDYTTEVGPLRLLMLDSTIPGQDRGDLDPQQLDWLQAILTETPKQPTLLVMHHPPLRTGIKALDTVGLSQPTERTLQRIFEQQPQLVGVLAGHLHRPIFSSLGGRTVTTAPSTFTHLAVDSNCNQLRPALEPPPAFLVHRILGYQLTTYVQPA